MKRMIARILAVFAILFVLCTEVNAAAAKKEAKEWTFMIFMNADNNLDQNAVKDMKEMRAIGENTDIANVIVMVDRENAPAVTYNITGTKQEVLTKHGEIDMGDYKVYANFVKDTIKKFPAQHYCSIIWNHGTGWKAIKRANGMVKGISYDEQSGNHMSTAQIGFALKEIKKALGGNKLDLLCFDACLMQMAEVAYTVRDGADYIVASEEVEPGEGYPYKEIFSKLQKGMKPDEMARMISRAYAESYDDGCAGYESSTHSVLVSNAYESFKDCLNGYCKMLMSSDYSAQIDKVFAEVTKFGYPENIDLKHFVSLSKAKIKNGGIQTAADKLLKSMDKLINANNVSGFGTNYAYGLAVFFPQKSYKFEKEYWQLPFAKNTMWASMVQDYYKKSVIKPILEEVAKGKTTKLKEYIEKANVNNVDLSLELTTKLNFLCFTEQKCDEKTAKQVKQLLGQLKNKL